jgi:hypothetical protein
LLVWFTHRRHCSTRAVIAEDLHAKTEHRRRGAEASARYRERRVVSCEFSAAPHLNHRKRAEQLVEERAARMKKRKARCVCPPSLAFCFDVVVCRRAGANELCRKHQVLAKPAPKKTHAAPRPRPAKPAPCVEPRSSMTPPPPPRRARIATPEPRGLAEIAQGYDSDDDGSETSAGRVRLSPPPAFERRVLQEMLNCPHCFQEDCPGCACMCEKSSTWLEHDGGHFFPTCTKCGGSDCPGCACVCSKAKDFIEHGGHVRTKNS